LSSATSCLPNEMGRPYQDPLFRRLFLTGNCLAQFFKAAGQGRGDRHYHDDHYSTQADPV